LNNSDANPVAEAAQQLADVALAGSKACLAVGE
jgi:hypothetical protein